MIPRRGHGCGARREPRPCLAALRGLVWLAGCGAALPVAAAAPVRNVVLFVGDGMGVTTVTAARIFDGQSRGQPGEENVLSFERFPHLALVKTYNTDAQVPDSAGTMTALVTGTRTRVGVLSVGPAVPRGDCEAMAGQTLATLLQEAEQRGWRTGLVTTTDITHATPAATYAHAADRKWQSDAEMPPEMRGGCVDIASQFVALAAGDGVDVALGGGRERFLPEDETDPEHPETTGERQDGRNLVEEWLAGRSGRSFVWKQEDMATLPADGQVLGLFAPEHMAFEADRQRDVGGEPSLAEMTRFAIERLAGPAGYFLMVEGGRIDHAHHLTNAYRALVDTVAFADAVAAAVALTEPAETLILVTADHSHTLTMAGYPVRGSPILGFAKGPLGVPMRDENGVAYTTLGYANGPGALPRAEEGDQDPTSPNYLQRALHPLLSETHGGEDVAAYALGVGAERVRGVMDQHELHGVMRAALFGAPAE